MVHLFSVFLFLRVANAYKGVFLPQYEKILAEKPAERDYVQDPKYINAYFSTLLDQVLNATVVSETVYPWIAKMYNTAAHAKMHPSVNVDLPWCTAVCIEQRIFITSAKCVYTQRVDEVWIHHNSANFYAEAFVLPEKFSKYAFDDIGFIVVKRTNMPESVWIPAKLYSEMNRTDDGFAWFATSNINNPKGRFYKAIGYAGKFHNLYELDVVIDIESCSQFYTIKNIEHPKEAYYVPCYFSCTMQEWRTKLCTECLSPDGGVVYNPKTKEVVGIATWGSSGNRHEAPVGFAVPNSKNFFENYECAIKIRNSVQAVKQSKFYQKLCDSP